MPASSSPALVTFRGGFVADWIVVCRLLDLEARGVRFELADGGRFRVVPGSALTADDRVFLRAHRVGRKPGRPVDPVLEDLRSTWLPTRSARTHARYKAAMELLMVVGFTPEEIARAVADAHRPNGSLNVNLLARYADWLARQPRDERRRGTCDLDGGGDGVTR